LEQIIRDHRRDEGAEEDKRDEASANWRQRSRESALRALSTTCAGDATEHEKQHDNTASTVGA